MGISGVVGVMVAILAMGAGFAATFDRGGNPDRAVVLRGGSDSELSSGIGLEATGVVASMEGVVRASRELYTVAEVPKRSSGLDVNLIVGGVSTEGLAMSDELRITQGGAFTPGKGELIAGRGAACGVRRHRPVRRGPAPTEWKIVGIFEAEGSALRIRTVGGPARGASGLPPLQHRELHATAVDAPETIAKLNERVEADPRLDLVVIHEPAFLKR